MSRTLSNGTTADYFKIVNKSTPTVHTMGPWCPTNSSDDKSKGGIWLEGGNVYDVDGPILKILLRFIKMQLGKCIIHPQVPLRKRQHKRNVRLLQIQM